MGIAGFIRNALSEANGSASSKRLLTAFMTIVLVPSSAYCLIYTTVNNPQYAETMMIAVLGSVCAALGVQAYGKKHENGNDKSIKNILPIGSGGAPPSDGNVLVGATGPKASINDRDA